jgi:hypothetical protein
MNHRSADRLVRATRVLQIAILAGATLASPFTLAVAQGFGGGNNNATPADPHDISGYWELGPNSRSVPTADLLPSVSKDAIQKMEETDRISDRWCRPLGYPAMMSNGRPLEIQQGKTEVLIAGEANTAFRHIYFRPAHINADIFDPSSIGDSIGHWEGDTFVADITGFHPKNGRLMIPGGGFRTETSHVVERYKLMKNGNVLSVTFTWTDPKVYKTPHSYEYRYTKIREKYEPRPAVGCDPYDDERTEFVERTFSPVLKQAAEAARIKPGTPVKY